MKYVVITAEKWVGRHEVEADSSVEALAAAARLDREGDTRVNFAETLPPDTWMVLDEHGADVTPPAKNPTIFRLLLMGLDIPDYVGAFNLVEFSVSPHLSIPVFYGRGASRGSKMAAEKIVIPASSVKAAFPVEEA